MNHFEVVCRSRTTQPEDNGVAHRQATPIPDKADQDIFEDNQVHQVMAESYSAAGGDQEGLFSNDGFEVFSTASNRHVNVVAAVLHC